MYVLQSVIHTHSLRLLVCGQLFFFGEIISGCFVADLDDVHCYSTHTKPHTSPLDFRKSVFYFLPSSLHAVSVRRPQQPPANITHMIDSAQFADADL